MAPRLPTNGVGEGPDLILVHGTTANRSRFDAVRPRLEQSFAVTVMDRRGYGDSGDHPDYALEREFEDILAVIDAVGGSPLLFGHSFGALCALGAAARTDRLAGLVLYEPWLAADGPAYTEDEMDTMDRLLAAGDREGLVTMMFSEIVKMSAEEIEALKQLPSWPARVASSHAIPREARAENTFRLSAGGYDRLSAAVLLLLGGDSAPEFAAGTSLLQTTLPNARCVVLPGQKHVAMITAPRPAR